MGVVRVYFSLSARLFATSPPPPELRVRNHNQYHLACLGLGEAVEFQFPKYEERGGEKDIERGGHANPDPNPCV